MKNMEQATDTSIRSIKAEILCVGTELLLGDIVNTNAAFIARELARIGVNVYHQSVVGDNPGRLKEALSAALERCDLVVTTGGLGPTYDDLTKETVAQLFGLPMERNEESLSSIQAFFDKVGRPMTENNKKQALLPKGAYPLQNRNGTAPGVIVRQQDTGKMVVMLPGPPREMQPMFTQQVTPYLLKLTHSTLVSRTIHIFGMGESQVEATLRPLMEASRNPTVAPYAKEGEVQLRVTAGAATQEQARALIDPVVKRICDTLGDVVYGVDVGTLQGAVVQAYAAKGIKLATAESCTGGLVSKRITEIAGSSAVFDCGVCSYANEIKHKVLGVQQETLERYGAVSEQTALEMARGVRKLAGAQVGVSTTGIAGPGGGSAEKPVGLVYVAADWGEGSQVLQLHLSRNYPDERELIRHLAASHALHLALRAADHF